MCTEEEDAGDAILGNNERIWECEQLPVFRKNNTEKRKTCKGNPTKSRTKVEEHYDWLEYGGVNK